MPIKYFLSVTILLLFSLFTSNTFSQQNTLPPSLYTDNWEELTNEKAEKARNQLAKVLLDHGFPVPDVEKIRVRKLLCYENAFIYEFEGRLNETLRLYTLIGSNDNYGLLKGTSAVIHVFNERHRPLLNTEPQLKDYVRLFVGALASDNVRFRVFDSNEEITRFLTPVAEIYSTNVIPSVISSFPSPGKPAKVSANLKHLQSFFRAELNVNDSGHIDMPSDKPLFAFPSYLEQFDKGGFLLDYRPATVPDSVVKYSTDAKEYYDNGMKIAMKAKTDGEFYSAYKLIEDAAAMGYSPAFSKLGLFYLRGDGVKKDTATTVALYLKGIERGDSSSKLYLARLEAAYSTKKRKEEYELSKAKYKETVAKQRAWLDKMTKMVQEMKEIDREIRLLTSFELAKNKSRFKNILTPGTFTGKLEQTPFKLFAEPLVIGSVYYDAFIVKPLITGYLYWSYNSEMDTKKLSWHLVKYVADKTTFEKVNANGYFSGYYTNNAGSVVAQNSTIKVEKGQEYIMWFSFDKKEDIKEKPFSLTVSATILNDSTKTAAEFYNGLNKN